MLSRRANVTQLNNDASRYSGSGAPVEEEESVSTSEPAVPTVIGSASDIFLQVSHTFLYLSLA